MILTNVDLAWLAGIIDGEGSIFVMINPRKGKMGSDGYIRKRDNYILRTSVQSADKYMIPEIHRLWPEGAEFAVCLDKRSNCSDTLKWQINGKKAVRFLKDIFRRWGLI